MLKKLITFIVIALGCRLHAEITSNIGIENNYLNDKLSFSECPSIKEKIKDFNLYNLALTYNLTISQIDFFSKLKLGKGTSHHVHINNADQKTKAEEKILGALIALDYLFRIGPLSYGPKIGFDYDLQKIRYKQLNLFMKRSSVEWYLPNIGLCIKYQPVADSSWRIYTTYDFGYGRVKLHSITNKFFKNKAMRNKFSFGSHQKIFKNIFSDIYFDYSRETSHEKKDRLSRESFECGISINAEF